MMAAAAGFGSLSADLISNGGWMVSVRVGLSEFTLVWSMTPLGYIPSQPGIFMTARSPDANPSSWNP